MSVARNKTGKALTRIIQKLGRADVESLLSNWNGSELSEDGKTIFFDDTRSGTGKWTYTKGEFFAWLFSDEPLDASKYCLDQEWVEQVKKARDTALEV